MIHCPSCETANVDDARFCERCGAALAGPADQTQLIDPAQISNPAGDPTASVDDGVRQALLDLARRDLADDYDVEREIGRGGMAVVFRAIERGLRRPVALKVLPPGLALGPSVVERFKREAQMAASLDHPNIIPIYRVGQSASLLYLAMRYVEGRSLDGVIQQQGALPVPTVLAVLRSATAALAYAHEHGIIHRDVKGANILIDTSGRVIVTDFGVARAIESASMTTTGSVIGTPYFMSPEACAGKVAGPQSDQYSLGVVAFQMLTAAVPFHAETLAAIMHHHLITPVPDVTVVRKDVPPALTAVVQRMLMKDPGQRYPTTRELLSAIEAIPLTDAERGEGEARLRDLAHGDAVASIATAALPPLADTMGIVAAHDALLRSTERAARGRRARYMALVGALVIVSLYAVFRPATRLTAVAPGSSVPATTAATTAAATAATTAAAAATGAGAGPGATGASATGVSATGASAARAGSTASHTGSAGAGGSPAAGTPRHRRDSVPAVDTTSGKVRLRVLPGDATIYVDGQPLGHSSVFDIGMPPGQRALHIVAPGYHDYDTVFTVHPGETTNLATVTLKPEP